jgi:hypothetical protein
MITTGSGCGCFVGGGATTGYGIGEAGGYSYEKCGYGGALDASCGFEDATGSGCGTGSGAASMGLGNGCGYGGGSGAGEPPTEWERRDGRSE